MKAKIKSTLVMSELAKTLVEAVGQIPTLGTEVMELIQSMYFRHLPHILVRLKYFTKLHFHCLILNVALDSNCESKD